MALPDWFKVDLNRFRQGGFSRTLMMGVDADNNVVPMSAAGGVAGSAGTSAALAVLAQTALTVDATSRALPTIPSGARAATLQLRGCDAYVRLDAQAAVSGAAAAHLVSDGSTIELEAAGELAGFRIIAASGTGTLSVIYRGTP